MSWSVEDSVEGSVKGGPSPCPRAGKVNSPINPPLLACRHPHLGLGQRLEERGEVEHHGMGAVGLGGVGLDDLAEGLAVPQTLGGRGMEGGRGGPGERGTWRCEDSRIFLKRKENSLKSWQAADKAPVFFYGKK